MTVINGEDRKPLTLHTSIGDINTEKTYEEMLVDIKNANGGELIVKTSIRETSLEGKLHSCDEYVVIDLKEVKILGIRYVTNIKRLKTNGELEKENQK